ncbi:MAG TPA: aspartate aminotransferase family protein [Chloroflexus aurantiacus]|jgi:glutamate-1-semialdehyde 2,1-aminomutase|uniref:Aminotransferase class-III n=1 Tax=Chloroflexus aurantiacus (strain ATCC 29366 / DSM 635 / J-10-fl) TaxID=324602 RepID=A9WCL8_CHLAA|nr:MULTISPECIES: aminotransferase class III-fold pyridoxal phosphate-dependent enzyme [Chloroflexus]ABY36980.1 aminotransferase class-III [Chloroflexus aurantiacus J-10-fl]RMG47722.1 MAG: aminotransferase class III-fold pyridoxal phosphate-dependent enzyme [Chloroflexota bacterium]HBW67837.1 aspartate aminotransferase family protein [Chloroflexus aurantiacus]
MTLEEQYRRRFAGSATLAEKARVRFPGGATHDGRYADPFPLFMERASGPYKWDVDDNRMIDYWCGHGALLLGHGHPTIVNAIQQQAPIATHLGANHRLELEWADLIADLIPAAERIRFTASGSEATTLALRIARAATGKTTIIRFAGHFHGWHDALAPGADPDDPHRGVLPATLSSLLILPTDLDQVAATLATHTDIAAVILEPTGASYGSIPLPDTFLIGLRELTQQYGVLLIADEVVTGFRVAPGGACARAGVRPDLVCLAKIVAGGLPGGALVGRADLLDLLAHDENGPRGRIRQQGTFNANPLSAAAGIAMLRAVATGEPGAIAAARGTMLIQMLNELFASYRLRGWTAFGDGSIFHLFVDPATDLIPGEIPRNLPLATLKRGGDPQILRRLRMALHLNGVDLMRGRSGFVSAVHSEEDIRATVAAVAAAIELVMAEPA